MRILISNDDGVGSAGIAALARVAGHFGEICVVAPHRERSTSGHSLTLHKPLRIDSLGGGRFATSGTPADCIYLGIREVLKAKPDLILSGINGGANLGTDIHYSGTVAAAREGALLDIKSYAFSLVDLHQIEPRRPSEPFRFDMAEAVVKRVLEATLSVPFPSHTLLNVNIPNLPLEEIQGLKVARQGFRYYSNEVKDGVDPRGRSYYWIGGAYLGFERTTNCDCHAVDSGWVSLTPITIDCTHQEFHASLQDQIGPARWR